MAEQTEQNSIIGAQGGWELPRRSIEKTDSRVHPGWSSPGC